MIQENPQIKSSQNHHDYSIPIISVILFFLFYQILILSLFNLYWLPFFIEVIIPLSNPVVSYEILIYW